MSDQSLNERIPTRDGNIAHAVGRIEGILEGIREDMKNAAEAQRQLVARLESNECRIDALESWRDILGRYERDRRKRQRAAGVVGLALLVPGIGWAADLTYWIHDLVQRVQPADSRPGPPQSSRAWGHAQGP
jgi:hypothetical protein